MRFLLKVTKPLQTRIILNSFQNLNKCAFSSQFSKLPLESSDLSNIQDYDSIVIIANNLETDVQKLNLKNHYDHLKLIKDQSSDFEKDLTFTISDKKRLIYSPTGPLNRDYDDVRRIGNAADKAIKKALKAGSKKPLLINTVKNSFCYSSHVSLLGALEAAYNPLEVREAKKLPNLLKLDKLAYWHPKENEANYLINIVNAVEIGRIVTRDIAGSDPERMSPGRVLEYVKDLFNSTDVKMDVIEGQQEFEQNYPCFAAVNRAANVVERHRGKIIKLEYNPSDKSEVDTTLFLVGKGITYDTGGADIKHGGNMASMHRDKSGAAFVAGFFKTLSLLKPSGLKVIGSMCLTRNNVGEECYVADEIITARSKKRIRIGNTDAEGRMAICDMLNEAKDQALKEKNPHLYTIATLTGHALRTYGTNYTAIMSNGPARSKSIDKNLQDSGHLIADPFEVSTIRREDYENHKGKSDYEDLLQANTKPSVAGAREHQGPAAFLIMASGLEDHGVDSKQPLPFTHVDIAGSCGKFPGIPSAVPLPSFALKYIIPRIKF